MFMQRTSDKIKATKKFLLKLKALNPKLYEEIMKQALWFLQSDKKDKKPKDTKKDMKYKLANTPELDPRQSPGPYVVKAAIDTLEADKKAATGAKRLYNGTLDAIFKDSFK